MPYGVTSQMLDAYRDVIFDLSLNKQVRRGDPVRHLDVAAWRQQRAASGLTDGEIAGRIGLAVEQVTFIRNVTERRLFRLNQYRKLFRLGGGMRYREDRYTDPQEPFAMRPEALRLRRAMSFDPARVKRYIDHGWWTGELLSDCLDRLPADRVAIVGAGVELTYDALRRRSRCLAAGFGTLGIGRGDVVAAQLPDGEALVLIYLATVHLGAVFLPLAADLTAAEIKPLLELGSVRVACCENRPEAGGESGGLQPELDPTAHMIAVGDGPPVPGAVAFASLIGDREMARPRGLAAADPILVHPAALNRQSLAPFSHQQVLASARAGGAAAELTDADRVASTLALTTSLGLALLNITLAAGAAWRLADCPEPPTITFTDQAIAVEGRQITMWGGAETQIIAVAPENEHWRLLDGYEIRAEDTFRVRGPALYPGYVEPAGDVDLAGWHDTGVRGLIDPAGNIVRH